MTAFYKLVTFFLERRRLLRWLIILFFTVIGISVVYRGAFEVPKRTDFTVFLNAAEALKSGADIYQTPTERSWLYVYSPLLAILLAPFSSMPLWLTVLGWYLLSLAALRGSVVLASRSTGGSDENFLWAMRAYVLSFPAVLNTLARGQIGVLSLFFAVAVFFLRQRGFSFWAGAVLAFAILLKPQPLAFLVLYFLFEKSWKTLAGIVIGGFAFGWLLPGLAIGFEKNSVLINDWLGILSQGGSDAAYKNVLWGQLTTPFAADNQSLYAVLTRWFWRSESDFFGHSNTLIRNTAAGFAGACLFLLFIAARKGDGFSKSLMRYSLFPVIMLLASPVVQIHHYTVLFLLFFAAFIRLRELRENPRRAAWLTCGLWVCASFYLAGLIFEKLGYWGLPTLGVFFLFTVLLGESLAGPSKKFA